MKKNLYLLIIVIASLYVSTPAQSRLAEIGGGGTTPPPKPGGPTITALHFNDLKN